MAHDIVARNNALVQAQQGHSHLLCCGQQQQLDVIQAQTHNNALDLIHAQTHNNALDLIQAPTHNNNALMPLQSSNPATLTVTP